MRKINALVSVYSLIALIVIIERLSPTTNIFLQPYNYIRLHEYNQTVIFLLATTILSFFILRLVTDNFQTLKHKRNFIMMLLFIAGTYLYGAGEGWHEMASFLFNTYCNTHHTVGNLCNGLFINDYYAENIIFFIGGVLMNYALLALSFNHPEKKIKNPAAELTGYRTVTTFLIAHPQASCLDF